MNIHPHPPPPINALAMALNLHSCEFVGQLQSCIRGCECGDDHVGVGIGFYKAFVVLVLNFHVVAHKIHIQHNDFVGSEVIEKLLWIVNLFGFSQIALSCNLTPTTNSTSAWPEHVIPGCR